MYANSVAPQYNLHSQSTRSPNKAKNTSFLEKATFWAHYGPLTIHNTYYFLLLIGVIFGMSGLFTNTTHGFILLSKYPAPHRCANEQRFFVSLRQCLPRTSQRQPLPALVYKLWFSTSAIWFSFWLAPKPCETLHLNGLYTPNFQMLAHLFSGNRLWPKCLNHTHQGFHSPWTNLPPGACPHILNCTCIIPTLTGNNVKPLLLGVFPMHLLLLHQHPGPRLTLAQYSPYMEQYHITHNPFVKTTHTIVKTDFYISLPTRITWLYPTLITHLIHLPYPQWTGFTLQYTVLGWPGPPLSTPLRTSHLGTARITLLRVDNFWFIPKNNSRHAPLLHTYAPLSAANNSNKTSLSNELKVETNIKSS